jgi:DNA-directed RNA polymerase specialized sigma subunit
MERCRHAQEELRALKRQLNFVNKQDDEAGVRRYREMLNQRYREMDADLTRAEELIRTLGDCRTRTILRYYYTLSWTDMKISEELGITDEWTRKKRYAALKELEARAAG